MTLKLPNYKDNWEKCGRGPTFPDFVGYQHGDVKIYDKNMVLQRVEKAVVSEKIKETVMLNEHELFNCELCGAREGRKRSDITKCADCRVLFNRGLK